MEQGDVALLSAIRESLSDSFGPCANPTAIGNKVVIGAASILRELPLPLPLAITLLCRSADCLNNQTSDGCTLASLFTLLLIERGLRLRGDGLTDIQVTKGFYQSFNFASKTIRSIANTQPPPTASQVASAFVIANSKHLNLAPICSSILCNAIESFKECFNDAKLMQAFDVRIFRSLPCAESSADPPLKVYSGVAIDQMNIKSGNYQILILNSDSIWPLESTQTITDFETFSLLEDRRKQLFLSHATIIKQSNANLVVCSGQLSPIIDCNLRANGILVFDSLSDLQIQSISEAISKPICYRLSEISSNSVGFATISQIKDGWSDICLIAASNLKDCCKKTIFVSAYDAFDANQLYQLVVRSLSVADRMTKIDSNDRLICGGFAIECEISRALNQSTIAIETSERLAVIEFADALIELSAIALSNCGVNSMEIISKIRLSQSSKQSHESLFGFIASPIDTYDCNIQVGDPTTFGLFDSSETKIAALQTATENACTLIQSIYLLESDRQPIPINL